MGPNCKTKASMVNARVLESNVGQPMGGPSGPSFERGWISRETAALALGFCGLGLAAAAVGAAGSRQTAELIGAKIGAITDAFASEATSLFV